MSRATLAAVSDRTDVLDKIVAAVPEAVEALERAAAVYGDGDAESVIHIVVGLGLDHDVLIPALQRMTNGSASEADVDLMGRADLLIRALLDGSDAGADVASATICEDLALGDPAIHRAVDRYLPRIADDCRATASVFGAVWCAD